jgi:enediyne biosynthesis protein E4
MCGGACRLRFRIRFSLLFTMLAVALAWACCLAQTSQPKPRPATPADSGKASTPGSSAGEQSAPFRFRDIGAEAGLTTVPQTTTKRRYIVDTMNGGGVALFDCNNDGKLDVAVVRDSSIERNLAGGDLMVTLYEQDGTGSKIHFTDITASSGMLTKGWATGLAVADFDNDGLPDLYVTGYGHNVLYHNLGNCKFEDVTAKAGVGGGGFSVGAAWADYDRDGHVDLFVARYVSTDVHHLPDPKTTLYKGVLVELPDGMPGDTDLLYRNRGDGTFEEVSKKAGVSNAQKLHGMGVVWGDYDDDGWPDLFVTNDGAYNYLFHNLRNGTFEEIGLPSGTASGEDGQVYGNMAADFGDFDHDGKLDLFVTRYGRQPASLFRNQGHDEFLDMAYKTGLAAKTFWPVKWGTGFGDFDNDGWPDVMIACGNFSSLLDGLPDEPPYKEPLQLFRNNNGQSFQEVADQAGLNDGPAQSRRGTAFGDVNNDGNLDALVFNVGGPPSLFLNETRNQNHRILLRLIGTKSNRMAIGARVTVTTADTVQVEEVRGGGSYLSSNDTRLHFGLGKSTSISNLEVRWPSGLVQKFQNVSADAIYNLTEGQQIKKTAAFPAQ